MAYSQHASNWAATPTLWCSVSVFTVGIFIYLLVCLLVFLAMHAHACMLPWPHHTTGSQRKQGGSTFSSSTIWIPKVTEPVPCDVLLLISSFKCFAEKFSIDVPQVNAHTFTVRMTGLCWVSLELWPFVLVTVLVAQKKEKDKNNLGKEGFTMTQSLRAGPILAKILGWQRLETAAHSAAVSRQREKNPAAQLPSFFKFNPSLQHMD